MKKIVRIREGVKIREAKVKELEELPLNPANVNMMAELIQALIPIGLHYVKEVLEQEVNELAGRRYEHQGGVGPDRWGKQWGSIYLETVAADSDSKGEGSPSEDRDSLKAMSGCKAPERRRGGVKANPGWAELSELSGLCGGSSGSLRIK
jgi:hypothetical protein